MPDSDLLNDPQVEPENETMASPGYATPDETMELKTETHSKNNADESYAHPNSDLEKQDGENPAINSSISTQLEDKVQLAEAADPNVVTWDGPEDPKMPMNWSGAMKGGIITILSTMTFITPLASSMFAPGVPEVMQEFKSTNIQLSSFVVSVYVLGYAFGPLIFAPLSELYGRLYVYHACNIGFTAFSAACALATNLNMLIGFRFLAGTFGSAPLTIGGGTIADMIVQEKRGGVMAIWALGPLMGPVIGPVAGGYLAQAKGWRWVFWVITIVAGAITLVAFALLRETYPPTLLKRKVAKLRNETGNKDLKSCMDTGIRPAELIKLSIVRPLKMLAFSPIVLALSTFMAIVYGYLYLLFTTITEVFQGTYGFSAGSVGLTYLGIGAGSLLGVIIFGGVSDRIMKAKSASGEMKPEYRLPPMIPGSLAIPLGLFIYGWTADKHVFWIVPIIGTAIVGIGLLATFMPIQTYLVDAFTLHSASALAANTVLRSVVAAVLPLAGPAMYQALGLGWGNSLLAFIALVLCPIPWIFYRYGEQLRKNPRFQLDL